MKRPGSRRAAPVPRSAARNNAEWCDIVCRTHGLVGEFGADAWTNASPTPRSYPNAVTLDLTAAEDRILEKLAGVGAGCSVKDSFAALDLSCAGFRILKEARWIHRSAGPPPPAKGPGPLRWAEVDDDDGLARWEAAWSEERMPGRLFRAGLLRHPAVVVLAGYLDGRIVAGVTVNRSESVVGLTNLFGGSDDPPAVWSGCVAAITSRFPGWPIVGYESGPALGAAQQQGFTPVGPLRVWINDHVGAPAARH